MKIYAIETTSHCNLECSYCPQPSMQRGKQNMPLDLFKQALDYPFGFDIVAGHLFGEPLLHPNLLEIIDACEQKNLAFGFSTNTLLLEINQLQTMIARGLSWLMISYHSKKKALAWIDKIQTEFPQFPILKSTLEDKHDWAGQVEFKENKMTLNQNSLESSDCIFHHYDLVTISSQGNVLACCLDVEGKSSMGHILDFTVEEFSQKSNDKCFSLCAKCHARLNTAQLQVQYTQLQQMAQLIHHYRQNVRGQS